ncbi:hypothetical protein TYRP_009724 [Tyrophagus putrescentiae]|nr:hypothetical protein TYRP_009724 [Tyrophagus putrescentiae]
MAIHFGPGNGGSSIGSMQTGTGSKVNEHGDILLGGLFPIHQKVLAQHNTAAPISGGGSGHLYFFLLLKLIRKCKFIPILAD